MTASIDLLARAAARYPDFSDADLCRQLSVNRTALSVARARGKLSPALAANLCRLMGENILFWTALAALENETDSYAKRKMLGMVQLMQNPYFLCLFTHLCALAGRRPAELRSA